MYDKSKKSAGRNRIGDAIPVISVINSEVAEEFEKFCEENEYYKSRILRTLILEMLDKYYPKK